MQLANENGEADEKMSPAIYAALIDSLFEVSGRCLRARFAPRSRRPDRAEDRKSGSGHVSRFSSCTGAVRAFDMQRYQSRKSMLTADEAARWEVRYQIGAMVHAAALGLWCSITLLGSDDAVAHMICLVRHTGFVAAVRAGPMDGSGSSSSRSLLPSVRR